MRLVCFQFVSKLEKSLPRYVYDALHGAVRASLWAKAVVVLLLLLFLLCVRAIVIMIMIIAGLNIVIRIRRYIKGGKKVLSFDFFDLFTERGFI